jgi:hypothetical protein
VTTAALGRRLDAAARPSAKPAARQSADPYDADVRDIARRQRQERDATLALVAFAQALAGTVLPDVLGARHPGLSGAEGSSAAFSPQEDARLRRLVTSAQSRAPSVRAPGPRQRLDHRTEATTEEVLQEEWLDQTKPDANPGPPPRPEPGFEPWGIITPSYARDPDDDAGRQ